MGLSHTALNVTDITHAHGGVETGGGGKFKDSKIYQSISKFQLNKQNTVKTGGGWGTKGPIKNPQQTTGVE